MNENKNRERTVVCDRAGCENYGIEIRLEDDIGAEVECGPCGTTLAPQADWYVPPSPEELGLEPAPERAADLIASMTDAERQELAALIAPTPPTLGQEAKQ